LKRGGAGGGGGEIGMGRGNQNSRKIARKKIVVIKKGDKQDQRRSHVQRGPLGRKISPLGRG